MWHNLCSQYWFPTDCMVWINTKLGATLKDLWKKKSSERKTKVNFLSLYWHSWFYSGLLQKKSIAVLCFTENHWHSFYCKKDNYNSSIIQKLTVLLNWVICNLSSTWSIVSLHDIRLATLHKPLLSTTCILSVEEANFNSAWIIIINYHHNMCMTISPFPVYVFLFT